MRTAFAALLLFATAASAQSTFDLNGYVAGRAVNATGPKSWLEGGWGRFEATGDRDDWMATAHVGFDWKPSKYFDLHAAGVARRDPEEFGGNDGGLVEAYADLKYPRGLNELQLRAGMFFIPSSRENIDPLWLSPYTINYSALNTWIGEEVRPIGVDLQYRRVNDAGHFLTLGATAFKGNDTMGTLVAWRGWSIGDRLSTYNETLPLPPLSSLADDGPFFRQRDDGTTPFRNDLDGRIGYAGRVRYSIPRRASIQYLYVDNNGDRLVYPAGTLSGEYSWKTKFHLVSAELGDPDQLVLAAEYMRGRTEMGPEIFPNYVEANFHAGYVMISNKRGRNRWTGRYEMFGTDDDDHTPRGEVNDESLRSWTFSYLFDLYENIRLGAEFTQITGHRAQVTDPDGHTFTLEARYHF